MLQLPQRLGLDLPNTLSGHTELLPHLFQRVVGVHADAEAHAQDAFFARGQRRQHPRGGLAQVGLDRSINGQDHVLVLDEIAEMRIFLVAHRGFQRQRLFGDLQNLANLLQGHAELFGQFLRGRFAADLVQHLARGAHDLVDGLDHVHWDTNGARLVGYRSRDRLPDPPRRIGRELVTPAVFEFVDRLHQADIAFLDQVEELQTAVGVFFRDRNHQPQIGLDHFLLGLARLALALLHAVHDLAEFTDLEPGQCGQRLDLVAQVLDAVLFVMHEILPALGREFRDTVEPARIELRALVVLQEVFARDAVAVAEAQQAALERDQLLVDVVELLDERVDTRLIQPQRLHLDDDFVLQLLVFALLRRRQRFVLQLVGDVLLLQAPQLLVVVGDLVESLDHLRLQLGLDGGERHLVFELVVVHVGVGGSLRGAFTLGGGGRCGGCGTERGRRRRGGRRRDMRRRRLCRHRGGGAIAVDTIAIDSGERLAVGAERGCEQRRVHVVLGVGTGVGRFQIDDVAEEDLSLVEFVAPDDDGLEGQRAFAQPRDHRLAAGLDALGNGDFALARQQLDGAQLAQIHPHGIVGALARLGLLDLGDGLLRDLDQFVVGVVRGLILRFLVAVGILGLGDVDANVGEHRHDVLDLLRRGGVGRQDFVELIEGYEAALLGLLDHLLDGGIRQIEQRRRRVRRILLRGVRCLVVFFLVFYLQRLCLGGHSLLPKRAHAGSVTAPALNTEPTYDAERVAHTCRHPLAYVTGFRTVSPQISLQAVKLRLTCFCRQTTGLASLFAIGKGGAYLSPPPSLCHWISYC